MSRGVYYKSADGKWHSVVMPYIRTDIPLPTHVDLQVTLVGAGGGNGGNDSHPGYTGLAGTALNGTLTVPFGQNVQIYVGGAGGAGAGGGSAPGGAGGPNSLGYSGGHGGRAGNEGSSGGGGGGGAATVLSVNGVVTAVAAGGGGGGGGGNNSNGQPSQGYASNGTIAGGAGQDKTSGGEHGGGGSIICTKLHELGYLSDRIYEADEQFGAYLRATDPDSYYGYLKWATTVVAWLEGNGPNIMPWIKDTTTRTQRQQELVTHWTVRIATPWAHHMAYLMGAEEQDSRAGKIIMNTGRYISRLIGKFSKTTEPNKNPVTGYVLWATFGIFWLLAGIK